MKLPGPDHPITIERNPRRVRARMADHVFLADTDETLILREADYPPVVYFPREAVEMGYAARTGRTSHCPYKGDASYYTFHAEGQILEDVAWSYEQPYPAMQAIAGYIAFYPNRGVEVYSISEEALDEHRAEHRPPV
jgi:uncharacterized protein (DUF427 family)